MAVKVDKSDQDRDQAVQYMQYTHLSCADVHPSETARHGEPAKTWQCGDYALDLGRTRVMGIVNVTPDSFSDGGEHATTNDAIEWGMRLLDDGADMLDIGGESTRPGHTPVAPQEEAQRVLPVIEALSAAGAIVSVDTRHAQVARAAVEAGADVINDVSGFVDPAMVRVAVESGAGVVCMRPRGVAVDPANVQSWLLNQACMLEDAGVAAEKICLDQGPGFDTNTNEDIALQRELRSLAYQGYPVLCAVSRKRFVGAVAGVAQAHDRDAASIGVALAAVTRGARIVRVHDVAGTTQALRMAQACWGKIAPRRALIALGANLGDRVATLAAAVDALDTLPLTQVSAVSHAYDTEPAYLDDQPSFANAVVQITTELHPMALLPSLLNIENEHGRARTIANGPRTLDVDLIWMQGETHAGKRLALPHPRMGERDFVLRPLADILAPETVGQSGQQAVNVREQAVEAFCNANRIPLTPAQDRLGRITQDLGALR